MSKKYKIGINVTGTPSGGSLTQIVYMLKYLSDTKEIELVIYSKKKNIPVFKNINLKYCKIHYSWLSNTFRLGRVIWEQLVLPFYVIWDGIDVLFCPGDISPIYSSIKKVQWIGTIGPFWKKMKKYETEFLRRIQYPLQKVLMSKSAERADCVIFESEYTQRFFLNRYNISKDKTTVINIGKDEFYTSNKSNIKSNYSDQQPYALCVSHLYPYKNIPRMIKCFYQANKKLDNKYRLLIAGASKSKEYNKSIKKEIDNHNYSKYITLLGSVSKESLKDLYQNTELLIFPSPCENFAYILVEAMSMGVPIVCSNTTAMPDTCKDAAIYFNPYNSDDMTKVIYNTMDNPEEKRKLKIKSLDRASSLPFYREVTQITLNCIMKLIDE